MASAPSGIEIRVAIHEAHPAPVGHDLNRVAGEERARTAGAGRPVQDAAAGEMPAAADERQTTPRQWIRRIALPEDDRFIGAGHPRAIIAVEEDRHPAKGAAPLRHPGEEVRVGDGDRRQTAAALDRGDRVVVDEVDAVPQHVAGRGLDQVGLLADGKARLGGESGQTGIDGLDGVAVLAAKLAERGPALALMPDVLALVLAHRAARRWLARRRVLGAAGDANVMVHRSPIPRCVSIVRRLPRPRPAPSSPLRWHRLAVTRGPPAPCNLPSWFRSGRTQTLGRGRHQTRWRISGCCGPSCWPAHW